MSTDDIPESEILFEHLTKVLLKIVKDRPADALNSFESSSAAVKAEKAAAEAETAAEDPLDVETEKLQRIGAHQQALNLIKAPKKARPEGEDEGEEEEEEEEKENVPIPDVLAQHKLLNRIGVDLGDEEAYKLSLSLQNLANKNELAECRFWGKIFGTQKDYYIAEGKLEDYGEEDEADGGKEPMGTGCNEYIYFVTNSLQSQEWSKLPAILPHQIKVARLTRRFFTGDLKASVLGFPRFPWGEAVYLRAQIARISHSTSIIPEGLFTVDAEDEEAAPEPNEEYKAKHHLLMDNPKNWVHARQGVLMIGRCTQPAAEEEEEEEDEEGGAPKRVKTAEELEKPPRRMQTIADDKYGDSNCWSLTVTPNPQDQFAAVCLQSNVWPGARTVLQGAQTVSCYLGWGHKHSETAYAPPPPPAFQQEFQSPYELKQSAVDTLAEQEDTQPPPEWTPPPVNDELPQSEGDDDDDDGGAAAPEEGGGEDE